MRKYFFSYQFGSANSAVNGFGDYDVIANSISNMDDIRQVKNLIQQALVEKGITMPTVVILSWRPFDEEAP